MRRAVLLCGLIWSVGAPLASWAAGPASRWSDVDAIVSYETKQTLASGLTRTEAWQERLVRRGEQVWSERVLPASNGAHEHHDKEPEHMGHKHLNAETSARWVSLSDKGKVTLKLVDREHKVVVDVPAAEYGSVSFDGRFDAAGAIVPQAVIQTMKPDGAATAQGQWHAERNQGWTHRVLWSADKQLAMRVESRREDGSFQRSVSVRLLSESAKKAPWQTLAGYVPKQYDEFMD